MKLPTAIATLFLVTSTALPAFAAMPAATSVRDAMAARIETVQYRQTPRQNDRYSDRYDAYRYPNGYNANASQNGAARSPNALGRDVIPGWPCEYRDDESSTYSAYPAWDICN